MTGRAHYLLTVVLVGGTAVLTAAGALAAWTARWPLDLAWATLALPLAFPPVIGYSALWRPGAPVERLERACVYLLIAVYMAIASSMLLLDEALRRTR